MPVDIAPNEIELSDLAGGYAPDLPESSLPVNASPDVLNLLLEHTSNSLETRKGFQRLVAGKTSLTHHPKNLYYYETIDGGERKRFIMAVFTTSSAGANNVQVWAYDLVDDTFTRVDTVGRTWNSPRSPHWGVVVSGTYYGGVRGDVIYSWHPTDGWDADPTQLSTPKTWVDDTNDGVNTATQFGRDYAFKKGQKVTFDGETFASLRDLRFDKWQDAHEYKLGDLVSRKHIWASSSTYWKSFECIRAHKSDDTRNSPGTSDATSAYWKKVRNPPILDDDDDITKAWTPTQNGVKSSVGVFYGDRMMVRRDNESERSNVQYSAPLETSTKKDKRIADVVWDPSDWAAVDDINGEGGGWFFAGAGHGDAIRGMYDMGNYLVIAKRWSTVVVNGRSEQTWSQRKLGDQGVVALNCLVECDGLVYGLSHNGTLWVTDGTSLREVPGYEKTREFIKERIDRLMQFGASADDDDEHYMPSLFEYDHKVWIALPDHSAASPADDITLVYDPAQDGSDGSWWKLDLPILAAVTGASDRAKRLYFSAPVRSGVATVHQYADDPGDEVFTDDSPVGAGGAAQTTAIPWHFKSAWFQFGLMHRQRRIRRTWAVVKTAVSITIAGYKDFVNASAYSVTRTVGSGETSYIEGKTFGRPVSSVALKLSGTAATGGPAIVGLGLDTEPVRKRFHRN